MKRFLFTFAIIAIALLSSCSDDDNGGDPFPLDGTSWISTSSESGSNDIRILKFKKEAYTMRLIKDGSGSGIQGETIEGEYTYARPSVVLIPDNLVDYDVSTGEIDGSRLILDKENEHPFKLQ